MTTCLTNTLIVAAQAIKDSADYLCPKEVSKCLSLLDICYKSNAKVLLSGVGKSGIVARKIASTFSSIGLKSVYLNPLDALHGDIGLIDTLDICFLISNSGETEELIKFTNHLKKLDIKLMSIVGNIKSSIAKKSDCILAANIDKELCPLNLAPTASTTVALAIGDAIAIEWMRSNQISDQDFAKNHPGGIIGKKLYLKVSDLMIPLKRLKVLKPKDNIKNIISEITRNGNGICLIKYISESRDMYGIITDGDLRRSLNKTSSNQWDELSANDIMTPDPIRVNSNELAIDALCLMEKDKSKPITSLFVFDNSKSLVGVLRLHDIIQSGLKENE